MKAAFLTAVLAVSLNGFTASANNASDGVIYGTDNRVDLYQVTNPMYATLAASTVALIKTDSIQQDSSGVVAIKASSFQSLMQVCSKEPFADQPSGAFCSGSLIGKHLMLTAGHCITSQDECSSTKFVFGYAVTKKGQYPNSVPEKNVVGCKSIVYRQQVDDGADFAIIQLDRDVTDRTPLTLAKGRMQNEITDGTQIMMIGHPSGLPTKVDPDKKVRSAAPNGFFTANTDSYGGNSGSAIFNQKTGEVEGVLVRGEQDFEYSDAGCYLSKVCPDDGCRGEDITKISSVIPHLPSVL